MARRSRWRLASACILLALTGMDVASAGPGGPCVAVPPGPVAAGACGSLEAPFGMTLTCTEAKSKASAGGSASASVPQQSTVTASGGYACRNDAWDGRTPDRTGAADVSWEGNLPWAGTHRAGTGWSGRAYQYRDGAFNANGIDTHCYGRVDDLRVPVTTCPVDAEPRT